jgi:hypothetical protein
MKGSDPSQNSNGSYQRTTNFYVRCQHSKWSQLKTLCRVLVRHRFLLAAGLSAAAGIILKSIVLIPVADPLFRYAALQRPGVYVAFVWSFAIFLFTTPFLVLSTCF